MAAVLDTLKLAKRFRDAKLSDEQAELLAEVFREREVVSDERLATKADLKTELEALRLSTGSEIEKLRTELHKEMRDLAWKMAGLLLAQGAGIVALVKLLPGAPQ